MAHIGYDEAYAAARLNAIDGQLEAAKAEVTRLEEARTTYAPAKKTTVKKSDD